MPPKSNDDTSNAMINALNHQIRRNILVLLSRNTLSYSTLLEEFSISTGKLNYHLKLLGNLIQKEKTGLYALTDDGFKAVSILQMISDDDMKDSAISEGNSGKDQEIDDVAQKVLHQLQKNMNSYGGFGSSLGFGGFSNPRRTKQSLIISILIGTGLVFLFGLYIAARDNSSPTGNDSPIIYIILSIIIGLGIIVFIFSMRRRKEMEE